MKQLAIHTQNYEKNLRDFAKGLDIATVKWKRYGKKSSFSMCLTWENINNQQIINQLATFLQKVAALENPIYRHLPKFREMINGLQNTQIHEREVKRLKSFLRNSQTLNLEGYIIFRMSEYRHKLDIISYQAVKKLELMRKE